VSPRVIDIVGSFQPDLSVSFVDYLNTLFNYVPRIYMILSDCLPFAKSLPNSHNLSENEKLAVVLYTWDIETLREDNFYYNLNKKLQENNQILLVPG